MGKQAQKTNKRWKMMISHSQKDQRYAAALVELLINIGIQPENILCSSLPGHLLPNGVDFCDYLRNYMGQENIFVIFLMSHNFNASAYCQNELGAAWVKGTESLFMMLPGFSENDLAGIANKRELGIKLDDITAIARLNMLEKDLQEKFSLKSLEMNRWETVRGNFLIRVNESTAYQVDMSDVNTYCIGDSRNEALILLDKEKMGKTIVLLDFGKTSAEKCSIVYFMHGSNFLAEYKSEKAVKFEMKCPDAIEKVDFEVHFSSEYIRADHVSVLNGIGSYQRELAKICSAENEWQSIKEFCIVFYRPAGPCVGAVEVSDLIIE